MARPLRIEYAGALYHLTARGNARQDIYLTDDDRVEFLYLLANVCERYHWICHAYCLMTNHYHLLIETREPTLSKGMKHINGTYTQRFNQRHKRGGHLFQGRYKSILVESETYLVELARYVVLNPVRAKMVESAIDWDWSSYRATAGIEDAHACLVTDWVLSSFGDYREKAQNAYQRFVHNGQDQRSPWKSLKNQIYLGSEKFIEEVQCKMQPEQSLDDIPRLHQQAPAKPLDYYQQRFCERKQAMVEAYRSGHYTLKQVGDYFGVSYATVSRAYNAR